MTLSLSLFSCIYMYSSYFIINLAIFLEKDFYLGVPRSEQYRVARIVQITPLEFIRAIITTPRYAEFALNVIRNFGNCLMCISGKYPLWMSVLSVSFELLKLKTKIYSMINRYSWKNIQKTVTTKLSALNVWQKCSLYLLHVTKLF